MTIRSAMATILGCTLLFAAIGTSLGYTLGRLTPGYYRSVFTSGRQPGFEPVSVGVGQGLTQGIVGGVIVGLVVVAILCSREVRLQRVEDVSPAAAQGRPVNSRTSARWVLLVAGTGLALGFSGCSGVVLGHLGGERGAYHRRFLEEQEAVAPVLASDPAFAGVELHEYSAGGLWLGGEVPTPEDLDRLRTGVIRAIGEPRAREAVYGVGVRR